MAKFLMISFKDVMTHSYSCPQFARGVGDMDKEDLKESYDRMSRAGRIKPEDDGLEVFVIGEFDDNDAKIKVYPEPAYITTLRALDATPQKAKKGKN